MIPFDKRLTPARGDIAAAHLEGQVEAARFVEGQVWQVRAPVALIRRAAAPDAPLETQAMMGEQITLYHMDTEAGWGWGQCAADGYVGHVALGELTQALFAVTHRVKVLRTLVFGAPDLKSQVQGMLSMNALVGIVETVDHYGRLATGGYVHRSHLTGLDVFADDFVAVAQMFCGAPYWWGGKDSMGLDCSGLVQSAMRAAGFNPPRDADMQEGADVCGAPVEITPGFSGLQRGDLVFWPGHVGIMLDGAEMLHANAHHMMCASEPLVEAARRIEAGTGHKVRHVKRPVGLGAA